MKILHRVVLPDKRSVVVIDEGNNKVTAIIKDENGGITQKQTSMWNWEEKLPKLLDVTKKELGL